MARGAGDTEGGAGTFILGLIMAVAGAYLLLRGIIVRPSFGMRSVAFQLGGFPVTTGVILVPFCSAWAVSFITAARFGAGLSRGSRFWR